MAKLKDMLGDQAPEVQESKTAVLNLLIADYVLEYERLLKK